MNDNLKTLEHAQRTAIDLGLQFGPKLVVALLIVAAGVYAGRWVSRVTDGMFGRIGLDLTLRLLLKRIVRVAVVALFAIMALQNLGVELLPLLAGLGLAGAGVALGMQGILGNLAAGLTIIFTRPFLVGEYISIAKEEGVVDEIRLFNTVLTHTDHSRIVIPNRKIVGEILHNFGVLRQLDVGVGVAYDTDIARALELVRALLAQNPKVLQEPQPVISVLALADSHVQMAVRPWTSVANFNEVSSDVTQAVLAAFRANGISMPVPQREVRLIERSTS